MFRSILAALCLALLPSIAAAQSVYPRTALPGAEAATTMTTSDGRLLAVPAQLAICATGGVPMVCPATGTTAAGGTSTTATPVQRTDGTAIASAANQSTQITAEQAIQANQTNGTQKVRSSNYASDGATAITSSYLNSDLIDPNQLVANAQEAVNYYYDPSAGGLRRMRGDTTGTWVHGPTSTPTAQGGTIAASGGTMTVTFAAASDTEIHNPGTATLWGSWGTPTVNGAGSYSIAPGATYRPPNRPVGTFTLLSTAANSPVTVTRF